MALLVACVFENQGWAGPTMRGREGGDIISKGCCMPASLCLVVGVWAWVGVCPVFDGADRPAFLDRGRRG